MRPIIGIVPSYSPETKGGSSFIAPERYAAAVEAAGGAPLILPITKNTEIHERLFKIVDGFVLTGGNDVTPTRYGCNICPLIDEVTPEREDLEFAVLEYADKNDIPVLGICRGMQVMNVFYGGTLVVDLPSYIAEKGLGEDFSVTHWQAEDYSVPTHEVRVVPGSHLSFLLGNEPLPTNSMHHQGIERLADRLHPTAYGPDGLIEAVEADGHRFMIGVQWHPEFMHSDKRMGCIFSALVLEASRCD